MYPTPRIALALAAALGLAAGLTAGPAKSTTPKGTHEQVKAIDVKGPAGCTLQTLSIAPDGHVVALVAPGRMVSRAARGDKAYSAEIHVLDPAGQKVRSWPVNFLAQAVNCGPDGTVVVAGDGRVATFDASGKPLAEAELPYLKEILADAETLKKKAEEQRKNEIESYESTLNEQQKEVDELKKKEADDLTKEEKQRLKQAEMMVKTYKRTLEQQKKKSLDSTVAEIAGRVKVVNAVAATDKDVYVVSGEVKGYGYCCWRMDRNFENPKAVLKGLRGCCGQMDVQASGDDLWVAQNCDHSVGRYDRDGKKLAKFGKRGRDGDADCFGGCCNPMNVRIGPKGMIYTAESEGVVRLFSPAGESQGVVGTATLKGGCKNVALAVSPDGNTVYFCDQPGSRVIVLAKKGDKADAGGD